MDNWFDLNSWSAFRQPYSSEGMLAFGSSLASVIADAFGKTKKLLVCDLDNTLWGGVIGDDGAEGLHLGATTPKGVLFEAVQSFISAIGKSGIVLALNTKNDPENITAGFELTAARLALSDFASIKANWNPKSENMHDILAEINLTDSSAVFLDDNPTEILDVSANIPASVCLTYETSPIEFLQQIECLGLFEAQRIVAEDVNRQKFYEDNRRRATLEGRFRTHEEFLKNLKMVSVMSGASSSAIKRLSSLSLKTNQFNLTQIGLSPDQVLEYDKHPKKWIHHAELSDIFGSNGIVSFAFGSVDDDSFNIENWVMSCRVFNRTLEEAVIFDLGTRARNLDCTKIVGRMTLLQKTNTVTGYLIGSGSFII